MMTRQQKIRWMMLAVVGGVIAVSVIAVFVPNLISGREQDQNEFLGQRILPVNVAPLSRVESFMQYRSYTGTVRASRRSDLGFELGGILDKVFVDEGDVVTAGEELARLDTQTLESRRDAMLAEWNRAKAVFAELEEGPRVEKIEAALAAFKAAESEYRNSVADHDRRKQLWESDAIAEEEYDRARFAMLSAKSRMDAAFQTWQELDKGTRSEQLAAQREVVAQAQSAHQEIKVAIQKSSLVAPFAGMITKRYLDKGTIAAASKPVFHLVEHKNLEAWIGLPSEQAAGIEKGRKYRIKSGNHSFKAIASAKLATLDQVTRTQTVIFAIPAGAHENLVSGQLCAIQVESEVNQPGFWVPTTALSRGIRGLWSLLSVDPVGSDQVVVKIDVDLVYTEGDRSLVRGPLQSGQLIVIDGIHRIVPGQKVSAQQKSMFSSDTMSTNESSRDAAATNDD